MFNFDIVDAGVRGLKNLLLRFYRLGGAEIFGSLGRQLQGVHPLILIVVSLLLAFLGKAAAKALAFILGGASLGLLLYSLGVQLSGSFLALLLGLIGFVAGGLLGLFILPLAVGAGLALVFYSIAALLSGGLVVSIIAALVGLVIGIVAHNLILAAVSSALAGYLLYAGLVGLNIDRTVSALAGLVLFIIGLVVQLR